jgi:hypothetical protein
MTYTEQQISDNHQAMIHAINRISAEAHSFGFKCPYCGGPALIPVYDPVTNFACEILCNCNEKES